ncbi:MAG: T9SS type A sorting domain-containing protein [Bacteroidetes bacterium]|nr:T9SS type A sorting domain-containing protein [Bacteroidota bacterium]
MNYVIPADVVADNSVVNIFVYKNGTSISTDYDIQQSLNFSPTITTGVGNNGSLVTDYSLSQNYPNPFNPTTNIRYSIPKDGNVTFKVYDMLGNEIGTYVDGIQQAGTYSVVFDGANLSSGIYYYKLEANGFSETKKMMLVK